NRLLDLALKFILQASLFRDFGDTEFFTLSDLLIPLVGLNYLADLHFIQVTGALFAIAGDKRNGGAFGMQFKHGAQRFFGYSRYRCLGVIQISGVEIDTHGYLWRYMIRP